MPLKEQQIDSSVSKVDEAQATGPATGAGKGSFFPKQVGGNTEAFFKDSNGVEIQLTDNGAVSAGAVDSVFGRTGVVIAQSGDYTASQVPYTPGPLLTSTDLQTALAELEALRGAVNGLASLDGSGLVPAAQLPISGLNFQGTWDANANSPALADGGVGGVQGDYFIVSVAGTTSVDGISSWDIGDWIINNGSAWQKIDNSNAVTSVNSLQGAVSLTATEIRNESIANWNTQVAAATQVIQNTADATGTINIHSDANITFTDGEFISISSGQLVNTALPVFSGAGSQGIVPDPVTSTGRILKDDGTWGTAPGIGDMLADVYDAGGGISVQSTGAGVVIYSTTLRDNSSGTGDVTAADVRAAIAEQVLNSAARHAAVTIGTANGLSISTQEISLALATGSTAGAMPSADKTKIDFISVTQAVNLDTMESDIAANNAKVTNATHTGDVTGSTTLTADPTMITGKTTVTGVTGDFVLISDGSDSGNLKKVDVADFLNAGPVDSVNGETGVVVLDATDVGAIDATEKGAANGVAPLDTSAKVPTANLPDSVVGALSFKGVWNATTNTPSLGDSGAGGVQGDYYKVSVAGSTTVDGNTDWQVGDYIAHNGSTWDKIDNTESVSTVFGRTGAILAVAGDYAASQVTNDSTAPGADVGASLDDHETRITANDAKVSASGSVTTHSDVTDAGSGQIITTVERTKLDGIEESATLGGLGQKLIRDDRFNTTDDDWDTDFFATGTTITQSAGKLEVTPSAADGTPAAVQNSALGEISPSPEYGTFVFRSKVSLVDISTVPSIADGDEIAWSLVLGNTDGAGSFTGIATVLQIVSTRDSVGGDTLLLTLEQNAGTPTDTFDLGSQITGEVELTLVVSSAASVDSAGTDKMNLFAYFRNPATDSTPRLVAKIENMELSDANFPTDPAMVPLLFTSTTAASAAAHTAKFDDILIFQDVIALPESAAAAASGYDTIQKDATPVTQRSVFNFIGNGTTVADNAGASRTDITINKDRAQSTLVTAGPYNVGDNEDLIPADCNPGSFTINLPASPPNGKVVTIARINTGSNTITVDGNGNNIGSGTQDFIRGQEIVEYIYIGTAGVGWLVLSTRQFYDLSFAVSDELTELTTGTQKFTMRVPRAFVLTDIKASVKDAPTGANLIVDVNSGGVSILSTKLSIDDGETTSKTAATPPVISTANLTDDAELTVDIDQVGSTFGGAGLKIVMLGIIQ